MTAALAAGGIVIGLGVIGLCVWALCAEAPDAEWRAVDRWWQRSGEDIADAMHTEVTARARLMLRRSAAPRRPVPPAPVRSHQPAAGRGGAHRVTPRRA